MSEQMNEVSDQLSIAVLVWCPECKEKTAHTFHMDSKKWECLKCGCVHK